MSYDNWKNGIEDMWERVLEDMEEELCSICDGTMNRHEVQCPSRDGEFFSKPHHQENQEDVGF